MMSSSNAQISAADGVVDRQHEHIIELINAVEAASDGGKGACTVDMVILHLKRYMTLHFATEERQMADAGYPELTAHKAEHDRCAGKLELLAADTEAGRLDIDQAVLFLRRWLDEHLRTCDADYIRYVRQH